jgi:hypothetical protein
MKKPILFLATLLFMTAANADSTRKTVSDLKEKFVNMREPRIEGIEKSGNTLVPVIYFGNKKNKQQVHCY